MVQRLVEVREEFNEPEIIDSKDILSHVTEPEPVRVHSETRPHLGQALVNQMLRSVRSRLCFCGCAGIRPVCGGKTGAFVEAFHGGFQT